MNKSEIDNRKRKNKTLTKLNYVLMMFCQFFCWHLNSIRGTLDDFSWVWFSPEAGQGSILDSSGHWHLWRPLPSWPLAALGTTGHWDSLVWWVLRVVSRSIESPLAASHLHPAEGSHQAWSWLESRNSRRVLKLLISGMVSWCTATSPGPGRGMETCKK